MDSDHRWAPDRSQTGPNSAKPLQPATGSLDLFDQHVRHALADVTVPGHLRSQLLARLSEAPTPARPPVRRRLVAAVFATALSLLCAFWGFHTYSQSVWNFDRLRAEAIAVYQSLENEQVAFPDQLARDFPVGFRTARCVGVHQPVFLGSPVNAYEFRDGQRRLLVLALPIDEFGHYAEQAEKSSASTNGLFVSLFKSREWVYLAVYRQQEDLENFATGQALI